MRRSHPILLALSLAACASGGADASGVLLLDAEAAARDLADSATDLSTADEAAVLRALDAACAGSWCTSTRSYRFQRLGCDFASGWCDLVATSIDTGTADAAARACRIPGPHGLDDLLDGSSPTRTLDADFRTSVDACGRKWSAAG